MSALSIGPIVALLVLLPLAAAADPATVEAVRAEPGDAGWRISVTLSHGDTGWDDYADGWEVQAPDGTVLGTRPLAHPHVTEQPFTRSVGGVAIPADVREIYIRARTNTDGWGPRAGPFPLRFE